MTRTGPSVTDRALLEVLAARGVVVSASQLERWRHAGLVPRPRQVHLGRGGSRAQFDQPLEEVAEHVAAVAARSRRGQSAALTAVAVTADGYVVNGDLLREGHREAAGQAKAVFERWAAQAAASTDGRAPADELEAAEQLAGAALAWRGPTRRFWRCNVAADAEVVASSTTEAVLESAVTAMIQLILGGDPSPGGVYEATVALGMRDFALAMAADEPRELDLDAREDAVATLMGEQFGGVPVLQRLVRVADAPPELLRAASTVAITLWTVLERSGVLGPVAAVLPAPTGDNPTFHTVAVAFVLHVATTAGLEAGPLCTYALEASLLSPDEADRCLEAAAQLSALTPTADVNAYQPVSSSRRN